MNKTQYEKIGGQIFKTIIDTLGNNKESQQAYKILSVRLLRLFNPTEIHVPAEATKDLPEELPPGEITIHAPASFFWDGFDFTVMNNGSLWIQLDGGEGMEVSKATFDKFWKDTF